MQYYIRLFIAGLLLLSILVSAHADDSIPAEIVAHLEKSDLKLTIRAEDAQKAGYILVMGIGRGSRLAAKRAATADAQRDILAILAELPASNKKVRKQVVKMPSLVKTTVSGKVKQIAPIFSYYNADQKTMYLLMRKTLINKSNQHPN